MSILFEEAQVISLNAMLDVLYNEQSLDTPYDGADEQDDFVWFEQKVGSA